MGTFRGRTPCVPTTRDKPPLIWVLTTICAPSLLYSTVSGLFWSIFQLSSQSVRPPCFHARILLFTLLLPLLSAPPPRQIIEQASITYPSITLFPPLAIKFFKMLENAVDPVEAKGGLAFKVQFNESTPVQNEKVKVLQDRANREQRKSNSNADIKRKILEADIRRQKQQVDSLDKFSLFL